MFFFFWQGPHRGKETNIWGRPRLATLVSREGITSLGMESKERHTGLGLRDCCRTMCKLSDWPQDTNWISTCHCSSVRKPGHKCQECSQAGTTVRCCVWCWYWEEKCTGSGDRQRARQETGTPLRPLQLHYTALCLHQLVFEKCSSV